LEEDVLLRSLLIGPEKRGSQIALIHAGKEESIWRPIGWWVATDLEHGDAVEVMTSHIMQAYKFCSSRSNSKLFLAKSYNCVLANAGIECWIL
jgi:hypothetical protein